MGGEIAKESADGVVAQWHQWLRHTRIDAPSIQEQQYDVSRQEMMKQLAAKADDRWKSIPSFLDSPKQQQPQPGLELKDPGGYVGQTEPESQQGVTSGVEDPSKVQEVSAGKDTKEVDEGRFKGKTKEKETPPWAKNQPQGGPGETWQPREWSPGVASRR